MKHVFFIAVLLFVGLTAVLSLIGSKAPGSATPPAPLIQPASPPAQTAAGQSSSDDPGFRRGEAGLTPAERAGREIWYKATAGNDRFHTYVFQQRIGVLIDWYRVLNSASRNERFKTWGLINDPGCCQPGSSNCPAKTLEETYGFDWCPGDETLLKYVGKSGYRDPACDFKDASLAADDRHGPKDQRQSSCDLAFGTSTGALGLRKFPNPLFDAEKWRKLNNGKLGSWEGYDRKLSQQADQSDSKVSHLADGSIEPPFRIGMACGACHIAFDPLNPPQDPAHPKWENIKGLVGNQYTRMSEIMVSGMPTDSLEWQVFSHARPGTTDTSAVPTDQVNNPGTINALINVKHRPTFAGEVVDRWRKAAACNPGEREEACWCEPGKAGKCWRKSAEKEKANHHILKGGEDSIGILGAVQRVYFNIGSCSEQCWVNHLTDLRQLDPQQRNFGQTPFDIGQCRRDCTNFRAIEDRLPDIVSFLLSPEAHATDLQVARENAARAKKLNARYEYADLVEDMENEFGKGAVARGRIVFAENCARCHSSQADPAKPENFSAIDFRTVSPETGLRVDFLSNDQPAPVSEIGTFRCRSLHSNHLMGHVWEQFASATYFGRPSDPNIKEHTGGGRGYYRNISLLSLWAHAPFMHNNAIGPEICGGSSDPRNQFYRSPYVDEKGAPLADPPVCWQYDPSVEGRFRLYKASMESLLNPKQRIPKITRLDQDIVLDIGPKLWDGQEEKKLFGFTLRVPQGTSQGLLGNFQHKPFIVDLVLAKTKPSQLEAKLVKELGDSTGKQVAAEMRQIADRILNDPKQLLEAVKQARQRLPLLLDVYSSCTADVENDGHRFGEDLPDRDKKALTAFLATL